MKLNPIRFRVLNFRNIDDSGWIPLEQVTAFVGRNEAGKTALLKALHKFHPAVEEPYSAQREFPRDRFTAIEGGRSFEMGAAVDGDSWSFGDREPVAVAGHGSIEPPRMQALDDSVTGGTTPQVNEVESAPVSRKPSFIERMTGSMRGSTQRNRTREPAADSVEDGFHHADGSRDAGGPTLLHDSFSNEDNLNIPSFLRRRE